MSNNLKKCIGCLCDPDVIEQLEDGFKIGCSNCNRFIVESFDSAFEAWDLINMDSYEMAIYAVNEINKQRLFFINAFDRKIEEKIKTEAKAIKKLHLI